ncbi:MAG: YegS/Rv2252/BmrU family lipid kinase, partial [Sporomusaceae bacterium]|nr:YegS/Rv2252/BmrU family lipid kinase [Sporomusaceae bacterium]
MLRKFILVYNPVSGDASFKFKLDNVIETFQHKGCIVIPFRITNTQDTSDFVQLTREVAAEGIIVSGGDGTIHEVVNIMLAYNLDLPLGIIPSGTSNDFAAYLQLEKNIDMCVDVIVKGDIKTFDVGKVNDKYFFNEASAGLMTSVAHSADVTLKNTLGKVAYYFKGLGELPNFKALTMRITADDQIIEGDVFLFLIMNSGTVGGFPRLVPFAQIDDGKLDLLIINKCNLSELMSLFFSFLKGIHYTSKHVTYLQAKKIDIECAEELQSDLDGELGPKLPLHVEVVPGKV